MRKLITTLSLAIASHFSVSAQYWQQEVNYTIDVSLNDELHSLKGKLAIQYTNHSPDTLRFIWFHIWPNAYKNDKTAFSEQCLTNGKTDFYFSSKEEKGYINQLDFKVNGATASTEDHPQHIDIIKVKLPVGLAPHHTASITTPFYVKLPYNFSRGGHIGQSYQATQWYPKPAVYDKDGWHPMPYLDQGEFYSEFGSFDISITLPKNYVVAATGNLQNADEKKWLQEEKNRKAWQQLYQDSVRQGSKKDFSQFPPSAAATKTLRYTIDNVHDFAWFADKRFIVDYDTFSSDAGNNIDAYTFYLPGSQKRWASSIDYLKNSVAHYAKLIGSYPYSTISAVDGPPGTGLGMEYPTITLIAPAQTQDELAKIILHEVGHNWFYGILANNERKYPWLDEGINSFYESKYFDTNLNKQENKSAAALLQTLIQEKMDQPIASESEKFSDLSYGLIVYYKTAAWMRWLEAYLGQSVLEQAMQQYFREWKFKHPQPEDLKKVLETVSGKNLDSAFAYLQKNGNLPAPQKKGTQLSPSILQLAGANLNKKNIIALLPSIGINSYDGFMAGLLLSNIKLPPNRFKFLIAPQYGFNSKKLTGSGFMSYSFYPAGIFRRIDLGVSASHFSINQFIDVQKNKTYAQLTKIAPSIKFIFKEKDPLSTTKKYIRLKSFLLQGENLTFSLDSVISPTDTTVIVRSGTEKENNTILQLKAVIENNRTLYPYRGELIVDKGNNFLRTSFTGNYFFNYPKTGGLNLRFFAGKFFYLNKTNDPFATERYHLNMTGANGEEDYTYSDYFVGRNKFEGFASQQIMVRDGGFKVRTDLLFNKVGKTDDWLIAANFTSSIPSNINPLSILPVKIPLKIFADIGTYADAWKANANLDRFVFDAGLQLSLFNETINIYLPLVYSAVYKNYLQSTIVKKERLGKKISFSIDLSNFSAKRIDRKISAF